MKFLCHQILYNNQLIVIAVDLTAKKRIAKLVKF